MKAALFLLIAFSFSSAYGQKASFTDNVLSYKDHHFSVGDTINISYGSGTDGKFVFVLIGSGLGGTTPLESNFSKSQIVVDKIYKSGGGYLIRGKMQGLSVSKFFIIPEGAIDKKEIE